MNYKNGSSTYVTGSGCNILTMQTYNLLFNYFVAPVHSSLSPETTGRSHNEQYQTGSFWYS